MDKGEVFADGQRRGSGAVGVYITVGQLLRASALALPFPQYTNTHDCRPLHDLRSSQSTVLQTPSHEMQLLDAHRMECSRTATCYVCA